MCSTQAQPRELNNGRENRPSCSSTACLPIITSNTTLTLFTCKDPETPQASGMERRRRKLGNKSEKDFWQDVMEFRFVDASSNT
jgi:hypothetical protein